MKHPKLTNSEKRYISILYLMYGNLLWYVSVKILKDRDLAEDAMQQTFEKIIKKVSLLQGFRDLEKAKQYMYVVARNTALAMLRVQQKVLLFDELFPESGTSPDPVAETMINRIEAEELKERVQNMSPTYGVLFEIFPGAGIWGNCGHAFYFRFCCTAPCFKGKGDSSGRKGW